MIPTAILGQARFRACEIYANKVQLICRAHVFRRNNAVIYSQSAKLTFSSNSKTYLFQKVLELTAQ